MFIVATTMATTAATLISVSILDRPASSDETCECASAPSEVESPGAQPNESPAAATAVAQMEEVTVESKPKRTYDAIVRRIVRAHINEVRYCYNQGLTRDPDLEGEITVEFTVGLDGNVEEAEAAETTLDDDAVEACVTKAVKRWKFPRPEGDEPVGVTYPFALSPG